VIDDQRFANLEAQVAASTVRDARREAEHVSLLNSYAALAAGRESERRDLEQDYKLLGKALDDRITGYRRAGGRAARSAETFLRKRNNL
jgi:hypothetical protein